MVKIARCGCVSVCSCAIQGVDSECLATDVTGQGSLASPYQIEVNPIIPAGAGQTRNLLKCEADGLKVTVEDVQDAVGQEIGPLIAGTCLVYDDANNRVNVQIAGTPTTNGIKCTPNGLQVIPSTDAGNTTILGTDGNIFTPGAQVVAGDCIEVTEGPTGTFTISADIDPDATNQLTCDGGPSGQGLYVPPTNVTINTPAQNVEAVEGPDNTFTFTCEAVPVAAVVADGGPCFQVTGDTCTGLNFRIGIDPDPCNGFECRAGGFFAPLAEDLPGDEGTQSIGQSFGPAAGTFTTQVGPTLCRTITNPSACKFMRVDLTGGWSVDYGRTSGQFIVALQASIDGGATFSDYLQVGNFPPETATRARNGSYRTGGITNLPPGGSVNVCVRVQARGVAAVGAVIPQMDFDMNLTASWLRG